MRTLAGFHQRFIQPRRIRSLTAALGPWLAPGRVLDIGCGDGRVSLALANQPSTRFVVGLETAPRRGGLITTISYDGLRIPFASRSFDTVLCIDTLHHASSPVDVLREASRVSQGRVVVKDHFCENPLDLVRLTFLDVAGNLPHLRSLKISYFSRATWRGVIAKTDLIEKARHEEVPGLYPPLWQALLGRGIQFTAVLERRDVGLV